MKTKAIIFDKDGTLVDFNDFWLPISYGAIKEILREVGREDIPVNKIMSVLGVEDGVVNINGVLCYGTYEQMGQEIYGVLTAEGCELSASKVTELTISAYHNHVSMGVISPACNQIQELLQKLKNHGLSLAVVTTDDLFMTEKCLRVLGIEQFFDAVYTYDGILPSKPDPYAIDDFCRKMGISKSEVVMVGDTLTDTCFAKNGGIRVIGVAKREGNRRILEGEADAVIPDISHILEVLETDDGILYDSRLLEPLKGEEDTLA